MGLYRIEFASGAVVWISLPSLEIAKQWAQTNWRNAFGRLTVKSVESLRDHIAI